MLLSLGSFLNFAARPKEYPVVRAAPYETVERGVGYPLPPSKPPIARYEGHLAFAANAQERLDEAGIPLRDVLDVQSLIFVSSQELGAWTENDEPQFWVVRAGREGENEALALDEGAAVTGWQDVGDLDGFETFEQVRDLISDSRPGISSASLSNQAGQLWAFVDRIKPGDFVVLPKVTNPGHVAIGEVAGPYIWRPEPEFSNNAGHTRPVRWLSKDVPYEQFTDELQRKFGIQGTVKRNGWA